MSTIRTKITVKDRLQGLIKGTQQHTPNGTLTFGGASHPVVDLIKLLQSLIDAIDAEVPAKAAYQASVQSMKSARAVVLPLMRDYVDHLRSTNGQNGTVLADYGLSPRKAPAPRTAAQKAEAAAKAKETRKLRGTMSPKQKAGIKAGAAPVSPTAPAPTTKPA